MVKIYPTLVIQELIFWYSYKWHLSQYAFITSLINTEFCKNSD